MGTHWIPNGYHMEKRKNSRFPLCKAHWLFIPGDMLSRYTEKTKKPAQVFMFWNSFIVHLVWCKEHGGSKHNMKLYILDKSMLNLSQKRKALCDITHME